MASGNSFRSMAYSYRMGDTTVSEIVEEVCDALWKHLQPLVLKEPTIHDWKNIAKGFKENCQFDHCVGAIDGKHVFIKAPPNSGTAFFNYKKSYSIVLLAVVDSNRRFVYIDVGSMGRFSDGGILNDSVFGQKLKTGNLNLPSEEPLYPDGMNMPYVFIGDEAFPLLHNLMRAYPQSRLSESRRIYNYRVSRARRVVENAFGILAAQWKVFRRPFDCRVELVDKIVKTTCVLHNFLINDVSYNMREEDIEFLDPSQLRPLVHCGYRYSNESFLIREEYCKYFNTQGAVPWQATRVQKRLAKE